MRRRWLAILIAPLACLDPVGPPAETTAQPPEDVPTLPVVTMTTVGEYRYLVHWDATPIPCPTSSTALFPIKSLQDREGWYGSQVGATGAQSLCSDTTGAEEVYRLAWIPSFHHTVVVRIERHGESYALSAVELSGAGGYDPGVPQRRIAMTLRQSEWDAWLRMVAQSRFWQAQTVDQDSIFDSTGAYSPWIGLDGAQWLLEARRGNDYHAVDRWSPLVEGPYTGYRRACTWLLLRTGMVSDRLVAGY